MQEPLRRDDPDETLALVKEKLSRPRTVFFPGHRIRMNVVPMFLNLFVPWVVFVLCCGLTAFSAMYKDHRIVVLIIGPLVVGWFGLTAMALKSRQQSDESTWFTYLALMYGIALVGGIVGGCSIFVSFSRPYYDIESMKAIHQVDAGKELGQDLMDVGIAYFAHQNHLDQLKSWHFMQRTLYCVAPVVSNGTRPETRSYDFWVVGKDCCSVASPDFRCGEWSNPLVRSGIRVLDSQELMYYRLAVQQAETLYGIVAAHPIFFTWVQDPLAEINSWAFQGYKNYVFLVALALVVSLICLVAATAKFAFIGRAPSAYDMEFYDDPEWRDENTARPQQGHTRNYSSM